MVEIQYGGHLIHKMVLPVGCTEYPSKPIYFYTPNPVIIYGTQLAEFSKTMCLFLKCI